MRQFWIGLFFLSSVWAQDSLPDVHQSVKADSSQLIQVLDFKSMDIKDIVRSLGEKYNLNLFIENGINRRVTCRLVNVTVDEAIRFLVKEHGLELIQEGSIYKIVEPEIAMPEPEPIKVTCGNGRLTLDLQNEAIGEVVRAISHESGKNILVNRGVDGRISGYLTDIPLAEGLTVLMKSNGFVVREKDGIYVIDREHNWLEDDKKGGRKNFWVNVADSLITLDVVDGDLNRIIREIATQLGVDVFSYGNLKGNVNAQCSNVTFEQILNYLFKGTEYTYRREGKIYFIGDKNISGIASTKLLQLKHIKVEGLIEMLPASVTSRATLQEVKEHNGIMAVASQDVLQELEALLAQIDRPIPQILIEALVVDFTDTDIGEFGLNAWIQGGNDSSTVVNQFLPSVNVTASSSLLNESLSYYGPKMGIKNIGRLPAGFMLNLRAMESTGKANIRSQPQIATLNGHAASIKIGTTQYYKLNSERPIVGGNQAYNQITQRFEKITAEVSLTITPWVSASGEITTEIKPEFSTPRNFDPEVPPTIDHRILESTVRLRDGETIVLGGLIQTTDSNNISKVPILGDIPVLGRLFQQRSHNNSKSKLMIYITPHLTYSSDSDKTYGTIR